MYLLPLLLMKNSISSEKMSMLLYTEYMQQPLDIVNNENSCKLTLAVHVGRTHAGDGPHRVARGGVDRVDGRENRPDRHSRRRGASAPARKRHFPSQPSPDCTFAACAGAASSRCSAQRHKIELCCS